MSTVTKLAAVREPGHPIGQAAPCWFTCPCGAKHRAFQDPIACACGARWTADGYKVGTLFADPVALVDHVVNLMERPMATPKLTLADAAPQMRKELETFLITMDAWLNDERDDSDTLDALDDRAASVRILLAKLEGRP